MIMEPLIPIFCIIVLGFAVSRTPVSSRSVWEGLERLTYYLFFPALLISRLSATRFEAAKLLDIGLSLGLALLVFTLLFAGLHRFIAERRDSLGSVYQGGIRFNTYIGLACIEAIYGDTGLTLAALCLLVYIPVVNVLSVIALTAQGREGNRITLVTGSVLTNPLVLACLIGTVLGLYEVDVPEIVLALLDVLSQPALPLGLLAVGAGIRFMAFGRQSWQLAVAVLGKLLVFPALVALATQLLGVSADLAAVLLLLTCLPAPPSAYILARQLGGDVSLMANIITLQTVVAFFTIPVWLNVGNRLLW
ncbi:MAG: AEC family transporter [Pseudohongiellaceae bacterium]